MIYDLRPFIEWVVTAFEPEARLAPGHYVRTIGDKEHELYGTSDMACILYTLGRLCPDDAERKEWAKAFAAFIKPETGELVEKNQSHNVLHNTAFALGAMNLLGVPVTHAMPFAERLRDPANVDAVLESIDWRKQVYRDSHKGAGMGSIFALVPGLYSRQWFDHFFARTDALFDANNGMMGIDKPAGGDTDQIGGTFHYGFVYEFFHRRMPFPKARIDAILGLQQADGYWQTGNPYWLTLDAIYMMTRTERYYPHRMEDVRNSVRRAMDALYARVNDAGMREKIYCGRSTDNFGRLGVHQMTATLSVFAEAQIFLGAQEVVTDYPLRLVLDARPFI